MEDALKEIQEFVNEKFPRTGFILFVQGQRGEIETMTNVQSEHFIPTLEDILKKAKGRML